MKKLILLIALTSLLLNAKSQQIERFNPDTIKTIQLDSVVVIKGQRLNIETFINAVINDTSFYKAFRDMKKYSFIAENRIFSYDKKNKVDGKVYRKIKHNNDGPYKMEYLVKESSGNVFKKNGKYQLYTVEMFDYIFMNAYNSDFVPNAPSGDGKGGTNESYKNKLKTLIFNPGRPIKNLPFIGSKTEIFTANMRQYYDYTFYSGTYLDSIPVYRFKVSVKPDISSWTKDGLMIKELVTIFDKRNFQILGRYVDMKYSNMLFDFDVQMNIEMSYFDEVKLPTKITYQGNWDYPFKKKERASFLIVHKDYKLGKSK
ncbi:hypothetical protein EZ428_00810 [Pedobacter frigiditerrae]|uniref:Uncharacterized protein n=1 Tax=Pedobacter frigiditerrae TaxID=2530452 RepID=A0A4R0N4X6_9SPHI|nr:hypothetical protein [Pedobacter frigiditerrae]TCC93344.1 hypothetical protein EZ428_00810 [Pedobacter frigiditerrae]